MGSPYSLDLRERVVAAVRSGKSRHQAAAQFDVSVSSAIRWVQRDSEKGSPAALPMGGKRGFVLAAEQSWLLKRLAEKPDLPLRTLLAELRDRGIEVSYYAVWHIVHRAGLRHKKKPARQRTRSPGRGASTGAMAAASRQG